MKPSSWSPRRRVEETYRRELNALLERYLRFPSDATLADILTRLTDFRRVDAFFKRYAAAAAERMVTALRADHARTWREAAAQGTEGRFLFTALQREMRGAVGSAVRLTVQTNAELVGSLPLKLAQEANHTILVAQQRGVRAEAIAQHLKRRFPQLAKSRAALIARTETSKASTALTRARAEEIGASWYVWETSHDERVRASHRLMSGVLINFNDPPDPERLAGERQSYGHYDAGDIFNCRCYPAPLLRWNQVAWPHKVYHAGRIQYMTLAAFRRITTHQQLEAIA